MLRSAVPWCGAVLRGAVPWCGAMLRRAGQEPAAPRSRRVYSAATANAAQPRMMPGHTPHSPHRSAGVRLCRRRTGTIPAAATTLTAADSHGDTAAIAIPNTVTNTAVQTAAASVTIIPATGRRPPPAGSAAVRVPGVITGHAARVAARAPPPLRPDGSPMLHARSVPLAAPGTAVSSAAVRSVCGGT